MLCKNCKVVKVVIILCLMNTFRIQVFQKMEMFLIFFNLEKMENTELFRINLICGLSTLLSCLITQTKHNYIYTTFIFLFTVFPAFVNFYHQSSGPILTDKHRDKKYIIFKKMFYFPYIIFVCACAFVYV